MTWTVNPQVRGVGEGSGADGPQGCPPCVHIASGRFPQLVPTMCTAVRPMLPGGLGVGPREPYGGGRTDPVSVPRGHMDPARRARPAGGPTTRREPAVRGSAVSIAELSTAF